MEHVQEAIVSRLKNKLTEKMKPIFSNMVVETGEQISDLNDGIRTIDRHGVLQQGSNTGGELAARYSFIIALQEMNQITVPIVFDNCQRIPKY